MNATNILAVSVVLNTYVLADESGAWFQTVIKNALPSSCYLGVDLS